MVQAFYAVCEPHLSRRRFLQFALAAGMAPALTSSVDAARDPDQGIRRFIERYAVGPKDPWALVHAIRGVGKSCRINGEPAAGYVLRTCVRAQEVNQRRYLYIPSSIEVHSNMFLKTFLEAGVPTSEIFPYEGHVFYLKDLGEGAKALFRFNPHNFDRDDLAWSLIAFAELQDQEWQNAYGERIQLATLAAFGAQVLHEATQELKSYATAGLPLPKKLPIHSFTCGGMHLCYSVLVAARYGLLPEHREELVPDQLQMLLYRLQADPELIDRYYREISSAPGVELFRAGAKLKVLGHALECLGYARTHALWQPSLSQRHQIERAGQEVRSLLAYLLTLDLAAIQRQHAQLAQQVVGDTCHAYRGLTLV
jgi:hypothetical protein